MLLSPIQLQAWLDEHREALKPPVGNKLIYSGKDFMVMAVAGPNARQDYHVNQTEELFYQLEGTITLNLMQDGQPKAVRIGPGELYLLPGGVPHSPQRPAGTIGLVIEKTRQPTEIDAFQWYCQNCHAKLFETRANVADIVGQLPSIFARFYDNPQHRICMQCGQETPPPPRG